MKQIKQNGMYALLIAVAACIGITIYASCSADEDYDYYSGNELSTRAEIQYEDKLGDYVDNIFNTKYVDDIGIMY